MLSIVDVSDRQEENCNNNNKYQITGSCCREWQLCGNGFFVSTFCCCFYFKRILHLLEELPRQHECKQTITTTNTSNQRITKDRKTSIIHYISLNLEFLGRRRVCFSGVRHLLYILADIQSAHIKTHTKNRAAKQSNASQNLFAQSANCWRRNSRKWVHIVYTLLSSVSLLINFYEFLRFLKIESE